MPQKIVSYQKQLFPLMDWFYEQNHAATSPPLKDKIADASCIKKYTSDCIVYFVSDYQRHSTEKTDSLESYFSPESANLFRNILKAMRLNEANFSIGAPQKEQADASLIDCKQELIQSIIRKRAHFIVPLGAKAIEALLGRAARPSQLHGQFLMEKIAGENEFQVMPLFHPDLLLINPSMKKTTWLDLQKLMVKIGQLHSK